MFATVQHLAFENTAQPEIEGALEEPRHDELKPVSVSAEYTSRGVFDERQTVTVHVAKPTDSEYPGLENELCDRSAAETGEAVVVEVQFVDYQQSAGEQPDGDEITGRTGTEIVRFRPAR
ncbi:MULTISPECIES: hypothetical protein [Natrialbaceae]|uniref:hypothetical protein n=1 Tax=Natrialbaceae TaxID=1644061 RepID=UPI00207C5FB9|nr:hypothetical protein [Natronococcus sp. CG52]